MMSRSVAGRYPLSTFALAAMATLAGCASRSLNAPPVEEWSNGSAVRSSAPPATAPAQAQQLYTVRRDDTLASIAKRFNTTPAAIAGWNNIGPTTTLRADQVLRVSPPTVVQPQVEPQVAVTKPIGTESVEQRQLGAAPVPVVPNAADSNAPSKTGPLGIKRPYSDAALAELSRPDGDASSSAPGPGPTVVPPPSVPAATPGAALAWAWPAVGKPSATFADGRTKGIDIPGKAGDAVLAAADGKVTFAGTGVRGYGNFVIVRHSPELLSVYAHNRANLVKEGAVVTKGQKIAEMGSSDTDVVKLHFEIRDDSKPIDPMKYLPAR